MSKHTPGPWEVNSIFANKITTADTKSEIAWAIILSDHDETIANACLIAAAPDLLLALRNLELGVSLFEARYLHDPKNITVAWEQLDQYKQAAQELLAKFEEAKA